jgi:hypothetical protein
MKTPKSNCYLILNIQSEFNVIIVCVIVIGSYAENNK